MKSDVGDRKTQEGFVKPKLFLVTLVLLMVGASPAKNQQWLLGDWDGKRQTLAERGIEFDVLLTLEGVQNVAGGVARSSRALANLDLIMDARGEALGLSENGDLHLYFLGNSGGAPTKMIGDIQFTSNIEAPGTFKLYEAWWRQRYADGRIAWLAGLHDYNALFDTLDTAGHFTNSSFGISPDISQVPPSIFPTTSSAFVVSLLSGDGGYLHLGAYDGVPGDPSDAKGTQIILDGDDGVFYALEAGIQNEATGTKLAFGGWHRTTDFRADFSGRAYSHNSGVYLIGETNLTDRWAGFFQVGNADRNRNQVGFYFGGGLVYSKLFMEDDILGIGLARAEAGHDYRDFNPGADDYEMVLECTYKFGPRLWMILQPGVQVVRNPGMDPALDDALAFSFRAYVSF